MTDEHDRLRFMTLSDVGSPSPQCIIEVPISKVLMQELRNEPDLLPALRDIFLSHAAAMFDIAALRYENPAADE